MAEVYTHSGSFLVLLYYVHWFFIKNSKDVCISNVTKCVCVCVCDISMCLLQTIFYTCIPVIMDNKYSKYCQGPETKLNILYLDGQGPEMVYNQQRMEPFSVTTNPTNLFLCTHFPLSLPQLHTLRRFVYIIISVI